MSCLISLYYKPLLSRLQDSKHTHLPPIYPRKGGKDDSKKIKKSKTPVSLVQSVYVMEDDLKILFRNIEEVYQINSQLLDQLDQLMHSNTPEKVIGNAVLNFATRALPIYVKYQTGSAQAAATLNRICNKNSNLVAFLKECEMKVSGPPRKYLWDRGRKFTVNKMSKEKKRRNFL
jgi:hypothetical protein